MVSRLSSTLPILILISLSTASLTAAENLQVTCGSTIKLQHTITKFRLHSHQVAYSRGSQQQSVTGFPEGDDGNSLWVVQGPENEPCTPGHAVAKHQKLRLQHVTTRRWLHSHRFQSPLSSNQEVSAFGSDTETDGGDVWTVEWDSKYKSWKQDQKIRLKHLDTGFYMHSQDAKFGAPIAGQDEVCCIERKDRYAEWQAAEGVYFPSPETIARRLAAGDEL
ncbi:MAG: hypothetical protein WDW38_005233 [Sanguina aurantia]